MVGTCYFCSERPRIGYWSYYCQDCANLRRMLLIYDPEKCISILKRTLTRDNSQIDYKVQQEIKKIVNTQIEDTIEKTDIGDESYKRKTRSGKTTKSI